MDAAPRRDDVIALLKAHRAEIDAFGVRSLALFGSVARDEARPDSDIDVLVDFGGPAHFKSYMHLKFLLEDLTGRKVDLVTRKGLHRGLRESVEAEALLVA